MDNNTGNIIDETTNGEKLLEMIRAKKTFGIVGWAFFIFVASSLVLQTVLSIFYGKIVAGSDFGALNGFITYSFNLIPIYISIIPAWFVLKKLPVESAEKKSIGFAEFLKYFLICFAIMYVGNIISLALMNIAGNIFGKSPASSLEALVLGTDILSSTLFVVIIAPIFEEFVFRKLLIDRVAKYGERNAVVLSGIMFGLFHMNIYQFFYAFGIGIVFAYVYLKTRKLTYSIILHMALNFMGSVPGRFIQSISDDGILTEEALASPTPVAVMAGIYSIVTIAMVAFGAFLVIKNLKKVSLDKDGAPFSRKHEKGLIYGNYGMAFFIAICAVMMVITFIAQLG